MTTPEASLDALLERVGEIEPAIAARTRAELAVSLDGVRSSAIADAAWRASCLTPARFPVEVAVTSARRELRVVVDVTAPEADRRTALGRAHALATGLGSSASPLVAALSDHQARFAPRWGAWLGSRHDREGTVRKLYVEVSPEPADARALVDAVAPGLRAVLAGPGVRFVGLPLDDDDDAVEVYARPPRLDGDAVEALLGRAGLDAGLRSAAGEVGRNHGVSVVWRSGRADAVALFVPAHHRWRRDHRVRREALARAASGSWPSRDLYEAATRPLAEPVPGLRPTHSVLSEVAVRGDATLHHHVGFAPPTVGVSAVAHHVRVATAPRPAPASRARRGALR